MACSPPWDSEVDSPFPADPTFWLGKSGNSVAECESAKKAWFQYPLVVCGLVALLNLIVISVYFYLGFRHEKSLLPAPGTDTLAGLASAPPPTDRLAVIDVNGERYFVWIGITNEVLLASGPPVYVFDGSGKLVGESSNIGDSPDLVLRSFTHRAYNVPGVSFKDALGQVTP